jgi:hypothetical protein
MVKFFFGADIRGLKIDGMEAATFMSRLLLDIDLQTFEMTTILFGTKLVELGLRKFDRDVNRRVKLFH